MEKVALLLLNVTLLGKLSSGTNRPAVYFLLLFVFLPIQAGDVKRQQFS